MTMDKEKLQTLEDDADTPMERANARVEAEMKALENKAREEVARGLQDQPLKNGESTRVHGEQEHSGREGTRGKGQ